MTKYLSVIICLMFGALNAVFVFDDPTRWHNWIALFFCTFIAGRISKY